MRDVGTSYIFAAFGLVLLWIISILLWTSLLPLCITGQRVKVSVEGFVTHDSDKKALFLGNGVKAFLKDEHPGRSTSNSLVFGTCSGSLIDIFRYKLTLTNATFETVSNANGEYPERNDFFDFFRVKLRKIFDDNHTVSSSGVLRGLVLGDKTGIGKDLNDQMIKTGTIHVMVASGFNVILISGILMSMFSVFVGRFRAYFFTIIVLLFYIFLTNFEAPILRAFLMYCTVIGGRLLGRRSSGLVSLFWAVAIMIVVDPWTIWDVGFQLSVAATYGLVAFKPFIDRLIYRHGKQKLLWVLDTELSTTFGAFLATSPVIWWHFGRVQFLGLVSNLLIGPIVPVLTVFGFAELLVSFLIPSGGMVSQATELLAALLIKIIYLF